MDKTGQNTGHRFRELNLASLGHRITAGDGEAVRVSDPRSADIESLNRLLQELTDLNRRIIAMLTNMTAPAKTPTESESRRDEPEPTQG